MKLKTHSGAKKRIRITGSGKAMFQKSAKRHLLTNKSKKAKSRDKNGIIVSSAHKKRLKKLLPYA
ncbi:50S ribosomal protein L35 [Candidatus Gracilibacteria bacterium CG17_big_fil_post_rev_8_21_14_2_50_48_13]|nr:MAG: 50S ribosomal protein L35 [Candidatus Gracilibacteria bacterium CG17_big_fil_post_rev_8_21_14_2_50_48_13]